MMLHFSKEKIIAACWAIALFTPMLYGQTEKCQMNVQNRDDMPVRIMCARITTAPDGDIEIYVQVENLGPASVEAFSVLLPDGPYLFRYRLEPGVITGIVEYAAKEEMSKTEAMILHKQLRSWTVSITEVQFREDQRNKKDLVPIHLELSTPTESFSGVHLYFSPGVTYFLDDSDAAADSIRVPKVVGYVRASVEIRNNSKKVLREIWCRFEGLIDKEWKYLGETSMVAILSSGGTTLAPIQVPCEIIDGKIKRRIDKIRLVIIKAYFGS